MSEPENAVQTSNQPAAKTVGAGKRRKRNLTLLTLLLITIALAFSLAYFLVWQFEETTEDAYVAGHVVQITPQIGGTVRKVSVDDTDIVKKGDVLVTLDDSDYQLAYERAQNELIQAIRQNKQQAAATTQSDAEVVARKADLARAMTDLKRRESLAGTDAISGEELSHARAAVVQAQAALKATEAAKTSAQAAIGNNIPLRQQPAVQTAISRIKDAWLNLQRTQIRSPMGGQIAKRNVQVGQQINSGMPVMAVVPLHEVWVEANFKENQLRKMRIGQPVTMESDLYGKRVVYRGTVQGLSAGTGSAFSLLPAQNATGNWIKVVQRVPVRISLDGETLQKYPLRVGLSMTVRVSTDNDGGKSLAEAAEKNITSPEVETVDWTPVNTLIDQVFEKYAK